MSKIDPAMLDQLGDEGWVFKRDIHGNILACKGPWLDDYYDGYTECLRENQNALRVKKLKEAGLNASCQTKEQQAAFEKKSRVQLARKDASEAALLASKTFGEGK